ncbi:hypothetical protein COSO111634_23395 [Corallococcus soli]
MRTVVRLEESVASAWSVSVCPSSSGPTVTVPWNTRINCPSASLVVSTLRGPGETNATCVTPTSSDAATATSSVRPANTGEPGGGVRKVSIGGWRSFATVRSICTDETCVSSDARASSTATRSGPWTRKEKW